METFGKMFLVFVCEKVYDRRVINARQESGENRKGAFRDRMERKVQNKQATVTLYNFIEKYAP